MINIGSSQRALHWIHQIRYPAEVIGLSGRAERTCNTGQASDDAGTNIYGMTAFFYSSLLLLTIIASFAFGIAAGYWVICGFLNLFNPHRAEEKPAPKPALVPSSGD